MRVLILGSDRPWRFEATVERAFRRAGHTTLLLDDRRLTQRIGRRLTQRWILARASRFEPEFVLLTKSLGCDLSTIEQLISRRPHAMWYSDPQWHTHATSRTDVAHIAAVARLASVLFVPAFDAEWRALGANAKFLPFAGDRDIVPVKPTGERNGVAFLGSAYDEARVRMLANLAREVPLTVWGSGWQPYAKDIRWSGRSVEGRAFAQVCSDAAITLGVTAANATGFPYYTDRMFIVMLAGGFYLGEGGFNPPGLLRDGEHCAWYETPERCRDKIHYYLRHPEERERIRTAGEAFVRKYHTYDQRITHFLTGEAWGDPLAT